MVLISIERAVLVCDCCQHMEMIHNVGADRNELSALAASAPGWTTEYDWPHVIFKCPKCSVEEQTVSLADQIYQTYLDSNRVIPPRTYLGASEAGHPCSRALWYHFRHAVTSNISGRMLRLFQSGHLQEDRLIADLRAAGHSVTDQQKEVRRGHLQGHIDGVLDLQMLLEIKTTNAKRHKEHLTKGLRVANPKAFFQMQIYLGFLGLKRGQLLAVCKDNEEIYEEIIGFDKKAFDDVCIKAAVVIDSKVPPPMISDDPQYYVCRFCDYCGLCRDTAAPAVHCRTCRRCVPRMDGVWTCTIADDPIPTSVLHEGCHRHLLLPELISRQHGGVMSSTDDCVVYSDGTKNGVGGLTSKEICSASHLPSFDFNNL